MYKIIRREAFSETTFLWEVSAPDVARSAEPGHFVMLRLHDGSERIPLTVADFDRERGTITMVIQALGKTTLEMRDHYKEGDGFADFVGPLGLPQHVSRVGHVVLVGGGLGVAPVYPQLRAFKEAGNRITGIIGFRNKDLVFWEDKFAKYCDNLIVCTDDGSYGRAGLRHRGARRRDRARPPRPRRRDRAAADDERLRRDHPAVRREDDGVAQRHHGRRHRHVRLLPRHRRRRDPVRLRRRPRLRRPSGRLQGADAAPAALQGRGVEGHRTTTRTSASVEKQLFDEGKRNYKKYKDLPPHAVKMPERDALERSRNFKEVNLGYSMADALAEAERCIQCSKPTCIEGCPVGIDIPRFIRHLLVRDIDGALAVINESNLFPSVCGRVCPQESQCEAQCVVAKNKKLPMEAVAIGRLERFVGDNAHAPKATPPVLARQLGRVAIVGSGPSGLAVAADLAKFGCEVTVFEALHVVGGVLQYGIPSFRLPREIIGREVDNLKDMGVRFETNKVIGKTFSVPHLMAEMGFDAVFVGAGAGAPAFLGIPGRVRGPGLLRQRVPHPRQPDGRRQVPLPRHADHAGQERGRDRRRQHGDGLPARGQAPRHADRALRLPPLRGRGAGAHRGAAPRQGGRHRVLLPARARRDPHRRRRQRPRHEGAEDGCSASPTRRAAASPCPSTSSSSSSATP